MINGREEVDWDEKEQLNENTLRTAEERSEQEGKAGSNAATGREGCYRTEKQLMKE